MEFQIQKKSITYRRLFYCLLCVLTVTGNINAEDTNEVALNDIDNTEDNSERSHFSRAAKYAQVAYSASISGQWHQAREGWKNAVEHLELSNASNRNRAVFYYEFGHAAGITCQFEIAEEFIEKSYQLEKNTNGPYVLTLVELFRLYFDQKFYKMATIYFEAALPHLIETSAELNTPAQYTRLLDEYADALSHIDKRMLANEIRKKSRRIRTRAGKLSEHDNRILYGSRCGKQRKNFPMTITQSAFVSSKMTKIREILNTMNQSKE